MKGQKTPVIAAGLVTGLVVLAVLIGFAVLLPKATGNNAAIELPDELPGGYHALDQAETFTAFEDQQITEKQAQQTADTFAAQREYGDKQLDDAYEFPAVTRNYVSADGSTVAYVTALRADGEAFAPDVLIDPSLGVLPGARVETLATDDEVTCITHADVNQQVGQVVPAGVTCRRTDGEFTLQVAGQAEVDVMTDLTNRFWDELAAQA
ncbi:hypothetical protein [Nocardioides insulae]|uniref:hypothetical protein n=1 Tax=Nocardioides insulae TaxID=394734 RepID=UPI0004248ABF|nr:hypothetical protein [Nocardioides insulae]